MDETVIYTTSGSSYSYGKSIFRRIEMVLDNKDNRNFDDDGELIMEAIPNEEIDKLFKECR